VALAPGCYYANIAGYWIAVSPADVPRRAEIRRESTTTPGRMYGCAFVGWQTLDELRPRVRTWLTRLAAQPDFPPPEHPDAD